MSADAEALGAFFNLHHGRQDGDNMAIWMWFISTVALFVIGFGVLGLRRAVDKLTAELSAYRSDRFWERRGVF